MLGFPGFIVFSGEGKTVKIGKSAGARGSYTVGRT